MANATAKKKITETIEEVTLTLTPQEARHLRGLLACTASTSVVKGIRDSLDEVGFTYADRVPYSGDLRQKYPPYEQTRYIALADYYGSAIRHPDAFRGRI